MKTPWILALVTGVALALAAPMVDAKRLGGGKSTGMQRTAPDKPAQATPATPNPAATPNAPAAPAAAAAPNAGAAAAAAAPKRSWLGPVAGLAAGLGLAALFSHLGMGEGLANFVMIALLVVLAVVVLRFVMRRFSGSSARQSTPFAMAGAGAAGGAVNTMPRQAVPAQALPQQPALPAASSGTAVRGADSDVAPALPPDFDAAAFERIAKMIFIRLQAANDAADLNDLRAFTTPEMFASARLDIQERGPAAQKTDVVTVDAQLVDFAEESGRQVVSVRYSGLVREERENAATPFDEVWHLVRPLDGSRDWAIAGIQQRQ